MYKHISRFGLGLIVLSLTVVAYAQNDQQIPQLRWMPKLESRPANEMHLFGTKMIVTVSIDTRGNVIAVNAIDGPGWICPEVVTPEVTALRSAAEAVAKRAKFIPANVGSPLAASTAFLEIEFPANPNRKDVVGFAGLGKSEATSTSKEVRGIQTIEGMEVKSAAVVSSETKPSDNNKVPESVGGGVLNGKATELPKPTYPAAARAVRATGTVVIQVLVDTDGKIMSAEPVSGHPLLRTVSRNAACRAIFTPTLLSGIPVTVSGLITYNFVP